MKKTEEVPMAQQLWTDQDEKVDEINKYQGIPYDEKEEVASYREPGASKLVDVSGHKPNNYNLDHAVNGWRKYGTLIVLVLVTWFAVIGIVTTVKSFIQWLVS